MLRPSVRRIPAIARIVVSVALFSIVPASLLPTAKGDSSRFLRRGNGIEDESTGLVWRIGTPRFLDWESARAHCRSLDALGAWRLPDVAELAHVRIPTRERESSFALAREIFGRATGAAYWSRSAQHRRDDAHRLAVDEDGSIDVVHTRAALAVRCVRSIDR